MSSRRLKTYSHRDFKEADQLGKIQMYIMQPEMFDLCDRDFKYYQMLLKAYHGCFQNLRTSESIKWIQANIPTAEDYTKAVRIYNQTCDLFGRFVDKNKSLRQALLVEKMYEDAEMIRKLAKKLLDQEDYFAAATTMEKANLIREKAAKMEGLDKMPANFNPEEFSLPEVIITSDPRALLPEAEHVEDIEYEDGTNETDLDD